MQYRFLIYISYSYAIPIGKPLEDEIKKRGYTVAWFSDLEEGKHSIPSSSSSFADINEVIAYDPHIILTITDMVPDFLRGIKVQIFHGFPANKRRGTDQFKIRGLFDLYCTQGPSSTLPFKVQQKKHQTFEVAETGWSKVDPLFPIEKNHTTVPVVLIASTFTQNYSLALKDDVVTELIRLSKTGKWKFIAVLHPKLDKSVHDTFRKIQNENFVFHETTDLVPLFKQADMMFADTTSAIIEFLLQEKPVVTFNNNMPGPYLINIQEVAEIEPALQSALTPSKELLQEIKEFAAYSHPYTDGRSSERVIDTCLDFLHKDKSHLKPKPLNLVRKFTLRKELDYFTWKSYSRPLTLTNSTHRQKVTAIIPAGNEIHNIEEVIASVDFADEILVVDSLSTDGTYEKASTLATRVIRRDYGYSASQKNWAIPQASHPWILLVDADERVTPQLKEEILTILQNPPQDDTVAYWIGRNNHFMGERVYHSGWRNDSVIRLFKRDYCRYEDKQVHAEIIADGKVGRLKNKFYHNTYTTFDAYLEKMNRYAWWQAKDYDKKTGTLTGYHFVIKPFWGFFKHYIIQGGFRDGVVGIAIGYIQGYVIFMRYIKLWLLRKNRR